MSLGPTHSGPKRLGPCDLPVGFSHQEVDDMDEERTSEDLELRERAMLQIQ